MYSRFVSNSPRKERVKVIKATYPNKTIHNRICESYNQYIFDIKQTYKLTNQCNQKKQITLSGRFQLRDELYWVIPFSEMIKNIMINYPIQQDVKIYEIFSVEDWVSNESVMDEYVTKKSKTYEFKNVIDWRDLLVRVIQYYKKNKYHLTYEEYHPIIQLTSIEKMEPSHLKLLKHKKLSGNEYVVRIENCE